MFSTISRGSSRVRQSYTCSSCRCNIQANGNSQQQAQLRVSGASRAVSNNFSTSTPRLKADDDESKDNGGDNRKKGSVNDSSTSKETKDNNEETGKPTPATDGKSSSAKSSEEKGASASEPATGNATKTSSKSPKEKARGRRGTSTLMPLSGSQTTLRALRDSLIAEPTLRQNKKSSAVLPNKRDRTVVGRQLQQKLRARQLGQKQLQVGKQAEDAEAPDAAHNTEDLVASEESPSAKTINERSRSKLLSFMNLESDKGAKMPKSTKKIEPIPARTASPKVTSKTKAKSKSSGTNDSKDRARTWTVIGENGTKFQVRCVTEAISRPPSTLQEFLVGNPKLYAKVKAMGNDASGSLVPIKDRIKSLLADDTLSEKERLETLHAVVQFRKSERASDAESRGKRRSSRSKPRTATDGNIFRRVSSQRDGNDAHSSSDGSLKPTPGTTAHEIETVDADSLQLVPLDTRQLKVPQLSYGLERVLFNPGVYQLQDPRSRVFNFDPYLQTIMPVSEFDFNALKQYVTSSRDKHLISKAISEKKKYTGSTSSTTSALAHFHFLLSQWREITVSNLSKMFPVEYKTFTNMQRSPTSIFLRWRDGAYAIDADKQYDTANILMSLGKSMEKLLTLPTEEFEKYRKSNTEQISEEERNASEEFHYTGMGDFLLRSQLDAYDSRLPGTGMFDLKTRAVVSVRMDAEDYEEGRGYEIRGRHGEWESFEREYYDMIRSAFLKYSLQVRMGRMDGIFVAFHNTERIFGFQYISLPEMDFALHGTSDTTLGDQEFKLSLDLLNRVLDRVTAKYPEQSIRLLIETRPAATPFTYIFAEPYTEAAIEEVQRTNKAKIEKFEKAVLGVVNKEYSEEDQEKEWAKIRAQVDESVGDDEAGLESNGGKFDSSELDSDLDNGKEQQYLAEDEDEDGSDSDDVPKELADVVSAVESQESEDGDELVDEDLAEDDEQDDLEELDDEQSDSIEEVEESDVDEGDEAETTNTDLLEDGEEPAETNGSVETTYENEDENSDVGHQEFSETCEPQTSEDAPRIRRLESDSPANSPSTKEPPRDMMAMTLTIRNKVNGKYVERPEDLTSEDKWSVEYALSEISSPSSVSRLYAMARRRRLMASVKTVDMNKESFNNVYLQRIRKMNQKGREWRKKQSEIDEAQPTKVLIVKDGEKMDKKDHELWTKEVGKDEGKSTN
ncbi:hypothetical protein VTL71DRAFT_16193 [Oculimacula yallundae]|uniref:Uncharacterized protein n=1 Tax=Oculimacula yallundae TaxID=86028 RepID=A0ABR4CEC8_9HELO